MERATSHNHTRLWYSEGEITALQSRISGYEDQLDRMESAHITDQAELQEKVDDMRRVVVITLIVALVAIILALGLTIRVITGMGS